MSTSPAPASLPLDYAPPSQPPRFGRLAIGTALLTIAPALRLMWQSFILTYSPQPTLTAMQAQTAQYVLGAGALILAIWILGNVLPKSPRSFPSIRLSLQAIASITLVNALLEYNLIVAHMSHGLPVWPFALLDFARNALPSILAVAAIVFWIRIARCARALWIAMFASFILAVVVLYRLVWSTFWAAILISDITNSRPPNFVSVINQGPTTHLLIADLIVQLVLWTTLAIWATIRWSYARRPHPAAHRAS